MTEEKDPPIRDKVKRSLWGKIQYFLGSIGKFIGVAPKTKKYEEGFEDTILNTARIKQGAKDLWASIKKIWARAKTPIVDRLAEIYNEVLDAYRDISRYIWLGIIATVILYAAGYVVSDISDSGKAAATILKLVFVPIPIAILFACRRLGIWPIIVPYLLSRFSANWEKRRAQAERPESEPGVAGKFWTFIWGEDPFSLDEIRRDAGATVGATVDTIEDVIKSMLRLICWTLGVYFLTWLLLRYVGGGATTSWWFVSTVLGTFIFSILLIKWKRYMTAVIMIVVFTTILVGLHAVAPKAFDAVVRRGDIYRSNLALRIEQGNDTPILMPAGNTVSSPFIADSIAVKVDFSNVEGLADNYNRIISAVSGDSIIGTISFRQHVDTAFSTFWIKQNCEVKAQGYRGSEKVGKEARGYYFFAPRQSKPESAVVPVTQGTTSPPPYIAPTDTTEPQASASGPDTSWALSDLDGFNPPTQMGKVNAHRKNLGSLTEKEGSRVVIRGYFRQSDNEQGLLAFELMPNYWLTLKGKRAKWDKADGQYGDLPVQVALGRKNTKSNYDGVEYPDGQPIFEGREGTGAFGLQEESWGFAFPGNWGPLPVKQDVPFALILEVLPESLTLKIQNDQKGWKEDVSSDRSLHVIFRVSGYEGECNFYLPWLDTPLTSMKTIRAFDCIVTGLTVEVYIPAATN